MIFKVSRLQPFGALVEPREGKPSVKELDREALLPLFHQHQIVLLRGFETFQSSDEFARYCERWGEISIWPFGKVLELIEQPRPEDHIFDNSYVPLHWDGMYRPHVPEYQIFHCVKAPLPGQGGRTTFSNTIMALERLSAELKDKWRKVSGQYQRKMEFYNSRTVSPLITKHPLRDFSVIRYSEPHFEDKGPLINPPILEFTGLEPEDRGSFHQDLRRALYSPENFYAHEWQDGDVVITDNFSLLHGREGFTAKSPRHLQRVQVLSEPPYANPGLESYR